MQSAETTYQQAKATAQEIDDKDVKAYVLAELGDVLTDRGGLAAARKSYEESLALRERAGEKQAAAETQVALARLAIEEGHAANADRSRPTWALPPRARFTFKSGINRRSIATAI